MPLGEQPTEESPSNLPEVSDHPNNDDRAGNQSASSVAAPASGTSACSSSCTDQPELKEGKQGEGLACEQSNTSSDEDDDEYEELPEGYDGPYKMVFVINTSLKMGSGKICAQVGHATLGLYRHLIEKETTETSEESELGPLSCWEDYDGEKKIALKGRNVEHLLELMQKANERKMPCYLVSDAGHTQIPSGSKTVLAIFGKESEVNEITGKLSLF